MGFDLYGLNPTENTKLPDVIVKFQDNNGWAGFDKMSEDDKEEYFAEKEIYNRENPGIYFRNNVWWWRPLWEYVCNECSDILTNKDIQAGSFNDGHKISKTKSKRIAARLRKLLKNGGVKDHENYYAQHVKSLAFKTCEICNGTGFRDDVFIKGPCNCCSNRPEYGDGVPVGKRKATAASYPFERINIIEFEKFCEQSGGFEIS